MVLLFKRIDYNIKYIKGVKNGKTRNKRLLCPM